MLTIRCTDALRAAFPCRSFLLTLLLLFAGPALAGNPHLVVDINLHAGAVSSNPTQLGKLGNVALLAAQVPIQTQPQPSPSQLVRSDGTEAGSAIIHTFDGNGPVTTAFVTPPLLVSGSNAYFAAHENATGTELWVTDGTAAGTHIVKDITPGTTGDPPNLLAAFQGGIAFTVHDAAFVYQLYVTDGTAAGTKQLTHFTDSNGGPATNISFVANGKLYFFVQPTPCCSTTELWVSDGTPQGTHVLPGLTTLVTDVNPLSFAAVGNRVVLRGNTQSNGTELITLDPTTEAFSMIDVSPGNDSGAVSDLTVFNGYAYFVGRNHAGDEELWRTDGTPGGTTPITNINPGPGSGLVYPYVIRVINNRLVFVGDDGTHGPQLWTTSGAPGGETPLTSVAFPNNLANWNVIAQTDRYVYAVGSGLMSGSARSVFATDGTPAGTRLIPQVTNGDPTNLLAAAGDSAADYLYYSTTINAPYLYSVFRYSPDEATVLTPVTVDTRYQSSTAKRTMIVLNGNLLYNFSDDTTGDELWVANASGTHELFNIQPEVNTDSSAPLWITAWNGKAVYAADDGVHGRELWESDGTAAGTHLLVDLVPGVQPSEPRDLTVWNGALYFYARDINGADHLMRMATSGAAPEKLGDLTPVVLGFQFGFPGPFCFSRPTLPFGNKLYLAAAGDNTGFQLWATDGTAAGTQRVTDTDTDFSATTPCNLTVLGNHLFFTAYGGVPNSGLELWMTDGTGAGTQLVKDINPGTNSSQIGALSVIGNKLIFVATAGGADRQTWLSDGTAAGTRPLFDNAAFLGYPVGSFNGKTFLLTPDTSSGQNEYDLWTTDGTASGTIRLTGVLIPGASGVSLSAAGLYFVNSADGDAEPWVSDGTAAGTHRVADLNTSGSSNPKFLGDFHGVMLMETFDSGAWQMWRTDGTATGTRSLGSGPQINLQPQVADLPAVAGQTFFFAGAETIPGGELYVVQNDQPTAVADTANASNGQNATINVLSNDADPDGSLAPSSVRVVQAPAHGTTSIGTNGAVTYAPTAGYSGSDSFTYSVADEQGFASNAATVTLTVTAAPPSPPPSNGGGGGGGGALAWLEALVLSLIAALRFAVGRRRAY